MCVKTASLKILPTNSKIILKIGQIFFGKISLQRRIRTQNPQFVHANIFLVNRRSSDFGIFRSHLRGGRNQSFQCCTSFNSLSINSAGVGNNLASKLWIQRKTIGKFASRDSMGIRHLSGGDLFIADNSSNANVGRCSKSEDVCECILDYDCCGDERSAMQFGRHANRK